MVKRLIIFSFIVLFGVSPVFVYAQNSSDQEIANEYYSNKEYIQ